jgi:hypothetical protein
MQIVTGSEIFSKVLSASAPSAGLALASWLPRLCLKKKWLFAFRAFHKILRKVPVQTH